MRVPAETRPDGQGEPVGIHVEIPGWRTLDLRHLVLDVNGTLSIDGSLLPGIDRRIALLQRALQCHLITADTYHMGERIAGRLGCRLQVLDGSEPQDAAKLRSTRDLGPSRVVAIGNGANDACMLREAALGICVVGEEGAAAAAVAAADVVCPSAVAAPDLVLHPTRLIATLRR